MKKCYYKVNSLFIEVIINYLRKQSATTLLENFCKNSKFKVDENYDKPYMNENEVDRYVQFVVEENTFNEIKKYLSTRPDDELNYIKNKLFNNK